MNASSSTPEFKIVKLDEIYAGAELVLSLFDVGDIGGNGSITFTNAFAGTNCDAAVRNLTGTCVVAAYKPDHQYPGGLNCSECGIDISNKRSKKRYNGQWLDFEFSIPLNYTRSGPACWAKVKLSLNSGNPVDTTTWAANINGTRRTWNRSHLVGIGIALDD
jgi:hypothetical protein